MEENAAPMPLAARRSGPLAGVGMIPGDKSVSHRALILGALAVGETRVHGLLEADDVLRTARAMRALGADVIRDAAGVWHIHGVGVGGFAEPADVLDFGNSGTGVRLVMGAAATTPINAVLTGDASLRRRPMGRVLEPLMRFGAEAAARAGGLLPVALRGTGDPMPVTYRSPVPSAQVKSAVLLAGLNAPGRTIVIERADTRDHTERMLAAFGAKVDIGLGEDGTMIAIDGEAELRATEVPVPRDPSSAAFPLVAALVVPDSRVRLPGVMLNPRRTGLIDTLREMGADIRIAGTRNEGGEEVGDLEISASPLRGVEVPPERAPSMIDEYPALAAAAAFAEGRTVMRGLAELRVKESDRLAAVAAGLAACGVKVEELPDGLAVEGWGAKGPPGGARIDTLMDHRIAMAFLTLGLGAQAPIRIDDARMIGTSFPGFVELMCGLGADIRAATP